MTICLINNISRNRRLKFCLKKKIHTPFQQWEGEETFTCKPTQKGMTIHKASLVMFLLLSCQMPVSFSLGGHKLLDLSDLPLLHSRISDIHFNTVHSFSACLFLCLCVHAVFCACVCVPCMRERENTYRMT